MSFITIFIVSAIVTPHNCMQSIRSKSLLNSFIDQWQIEMTVTWVPEYKNSFLNEKTKKYIFSRPELPLANNFATLNVFILKYECLINKFTVTLGNGDIKNMACKKTCDANEEHENIYFDEFKVTMSGLSKIDSNHKHYHIRPRCSNMRISFCNQNLNDKKFIQLLFSKKYHIYLYYPNIMCKETSTSITMKTNMFIIWLIKSIEKFCAEKLVKYKSINAFRPIFVYNSIKGKLDVGNAKLQEYFTKISTKLAMSILKKEYINKRPLNIDKILIQAVDDHIAYIARLMLIFCAAQGPHMRVLWGIPVNGTQYPKVAVHECLHRRKKSETRLKL